MISEFLTRRRALLAPAALGSVILLWLLWLLAAAGCGETRGPSDHVSASLRMRAAARLRAGDTVSAGRFLAKAEKLNADSAETQILIGEVLRQEGNLDLAEARYRRALEIDPDSAEAHLNLGVLYGTKGNLEDALREFEAAARDENFANRDLAYDNIGQIHLERGERNPAERAFRSSVSLNGEWAVSQANLGRVLYENGDLEGAEACFLKALALDPAFIEARYRLALVHIRLGRRTAAVEELRKVIGLAPGGLYSDDAREQLALIE